MKFVETDPGIMIEITHSLLAQGCNFRLAQMSRSSRLAYHNAVTNDVWQFTEMATFEQEATTDVKLA